MTNWLNTMTLILFVCLMACSISNTEMVGDVKIERPCHVVEIIPPPIIDALNYEIKALRPLEYEVSITNIANAAVYIPYEKASDRGTDSVAFFLTRLNENGHFALYGESSDFAPSLQPLRPGDSLKVYVALFQDGIYRLNLQYYSDESLVKIVNRTECRFEWSGEDEKRISENRVMSHSPTITIGGTY